MEVIAILLFTIITSIKTLREGGRNSALSFFVLLIFIHDQKNGIFKNNNKLVWIVFKYNLFLAWNIFKN